MGVTWAVNAITAIVTSIVTGNGRKENSHYIMLTVTVTLKMNLDIFSKQQ